MKTHIAAVVCLNWQEDADKKKVHIRNFLLPAKYSYYFYNCFSKTLLNDGLHLDLLVPSLFLATCQLKFDGGLSCLS